MEILGFRFLLRQKKALEQGCQTYGEPKGPIWPAGWNVNVL